MKLSSDQNGDPLELENWIQSVQAAVKTGCTATSDIKKDVISSAISLRVFPSLLQGRATSYSALRDADASANSNAKAHESLPSWMATHLHGASVWSDQVVHQRAPQLADGSGEVALGVVNVSVEHHKAL
ncbi:hypothetical protein BD310DRAFT_982762 [Dichomitus squalens]|uniref:PH domain-containing protein n=1 Tax=Dichomitus squalens TaxID=114155 RepID=A0A4V2K674_9APHY|nr:hypothetical protein BD310DRAFT_982762 [Dichomitus squalens]